MAPTPIPDPRRPAPLAGALDALEARSDGTRGAAGLVARLQLIEGYRA